MSNFKNKKNRAFHPPLISEGREDIDLGLEQGRKNLWQFRAGLQFHHHHGGLGVRDRLQLVLRLAGFPEPSPAPAAGSTP